MNKDEALKLALAALKESTKYFNIVRLGESRLKDTEIRCASHEAMIAIQEALAQPEQEPNCQATGVCVRSGLYVAQQDHIPDAGKLVTKEASLPAQSPVAWVTPHGEGWRMRFDPPVTGVPLGWEPLYASPPARKELIDLMDEQIDSILKMVTTNTPFSWREFARAIEQKSKDLNA